MGFTLVRRPASTARPPRTHRLFFDDSYVAGALDTLREAASDAALHERLDEIAIARADLWFG